MKTFENRSFKSAKSSPIKASRIITSQSLSPVKSQLYNTLNSDKKHIITKLLYLFTFYSSKISKYSYRQLNEKVFILLIGDLYLSKNHKQLLKNSVLQKQYLNIYYSQRGKKTGSGLKFEQFLQCLPIISVYMCSQIDQRQQAVKQLIQYLVALYETKIAGMIENHIVDYQQPINDQTKQMIVKMMPSFNTVYKKLYFNHEFTGKFNTTDCQHESFQALIKMMKDFQVFPRLISASQLFLLYHTTINADPNNLLHETEFSRHRIQQCGEIFTLSKMIELFIACSRICFGRLRNLQNPEYDIAHQKEIFKTFLQYMEAIKTTKTSARAIELFKEHRFSFILLEEYQYENQKDKMTKTFVLKDKIIKESQKEMEFFGLFDKLQL